MKLNLENAIRAAKLIKIIKKGEGPLGMDISLTNRCNFNCFFCVSRDEKPCDMDSDVLDNLLYDLFAMGTSEITLSGNGEQMLHKNFWDVVNSQFKVKIVTNGSVLHKICEERFRKIHKLTISLNSVVAMNHIKIHQIDSLHTLPNIIAQIEKLLKFPDARHKM